MKYIWFLGVVGVMVGLLSFTLGRKHLLSMLLSLEYVSLNLFLLLVYVFGWYVGEDYLLLYFLIMIVCEGVLGLGVVVGVVRLSGNDYFSSFNLLKC